MIRSFALALAISTVRVVAALLDRAPLTPAEVLLPSYLATLPPGE